jgi:hypothetical protein
MIRTLVSTFAISIGGLALASGCGQKQVAHPDEGAHAPSLPSTTAPTQPPPPAQTATNAKPAADHAPSAQPFSGPGVQLSYGGDWHATDHAEYALVIVPEGAGKSSDVSVTVEVPDLPPHIPGMIPLGRVVKGSIDDIKKEHADAHVEAPTTTKVAGTNARRVVTTWSADGKELAEDAVLTVHGDHVYIFRANADQPNRDRASHELDQLLESVRWQ